MIATLVELVEMKHYLRKQYQEAMINANNKSSLQRSYGYADSILAKIHILDKQIAEY